MPNNVKKLRVAKGYTQAQLAKLAGLTQQQVQRAESGTHTVRLDVAAAITTALGATFGEAFPEVGKHAPGLARRRNLNPQQIYFERSPSNLDKAGIDADPEYWTVKVHMPCGQDRFYPISSGDVQRLRSAMISGRIGSFFCFESRHFLVCLRPSAAHFIHLLWERADIGAQQEASDPGVAADCGSILRLHFANGSAMAEFDVDVDEPDESKDNDLDASPLTALSMELESWDPAFGMVSFSDEDGEEVFLNPEHLVAIEIPLATADVEDED